MYLTNRLRQNHHLILHGHPYRPCLQPQQDMSSLSTSGRKLLSKHWIRVEFLENGLSEDHESLHACLGQADS